MIHINVKEDFNSLIKSYKSMNDPEDSYPGQIEYHGVVLSANIGKFREDMEIRTVYVDFLEGLVGFGVGDEEDETEVTWYDITYINNQPCFDENTYSMKY